MAEPEVLHDRHTELVKKVSSLRWVAVIETVSYLALLYFWLSGNDIGTKIVGSIHGMVWIAFCGMLLGVRAPMRWSWEYVGLGIVTGPIGALIVHERIRREGVPADARA